MSTSPSDINQALLEVRKGFRLLHNYQRLALDAVNHIGTQLGFRYAGGYARFSDNTPKAGKGGLDFWAWDWLNMMWYEFYFELEGVDPAPFYLSIWLVSDTGYFASADPAAERYAVEGFASPEASGTKLVFLLYDAEADYDALYAVSADAKEELRRFFVEGVTPQLFEQYKVFGRCYDFAEVRDEPSTDALIDNLIQSAKAKGYTLARVNKAT